MNLLIGYEIGFDELDELDESDYLMIEFKENNPKALDFKLFPSDYSVCLIDERLLVFDGEMNLVLRVQTKYIQKMLIISEG